MSKKRKKQQIEEEIEVQPVKEKKASSKSVKEEFRKFFVKIRRSKKIPKELEKVIWLHFKSAGFDSPEKFEDGLKHFGL